MKKWEFHVAHQERFVSDEQEAMDRMGEDGWELVSVSDGRLYYRRELHAAPVSS